MYSTDTVYYYAISSYKLTLFNLDLCRREHWALFSTFTTWQQVLDITKKESRDHQTLSEIYGNQMVQRFNSIMDNSQRIHKNVRLAAQC